MEELYSETAKIVSFPGLHPAIGTGLIIVRVVPFLTRFLMRAVGNASKMS